MKRFWLYLLICGIAGWQTHVLARERLPDSLEAGGGYASPTYDSSLVLEVIDSGKALRFTDSRRAEEHYQLAAMASRATGFTEGLVQSLTGLAEVSVYAGRYDQAIRNYQEALHYRKEVSMKTLSDVYNGLAGVYTYKSHYARAVYFYYKYLEIAETNGDRPAPLARTYNNLSALWFMLRDEEKQLRYTTLAEKAAKAEGDSISLGIAIFRRGNYYADTNDVLALDCFRRALAIGKQVGDNHTVIASMLNIARVYRHRGDRAAAIRSYRTVETMLEGGPENPFHKLSFYNSLGEGYYMLGMDKLAEQQALKVIRHSEKMQSRTYLGRAYQLLAAIYERAGDFPRAFESQKAYIGLKDSLAGEREVQSANLSELKYLTVKQDHELALRKLEIANQEARLLRKNMLIVGISIGILLLAIISWVLSRNMRMKIRVQQESIRALQKEKEIEQMKPIMKGEDQESVRIGQELHDGIGSMLSVIKMNLSMIQHQHPMLHESASYQQILSLIDTTSTDLRETAYNLMLDSLLQGGIDEALQLCCEKCSTKYQVDVHFLSYGTPPPLSPDFTRSVYRIMRELLYHIVRQKNVTLVVMQLNWQEDLLSIILEDDAKNFVHEDMMNYLKRESGIFSRIVALQGCIDIDFSPDKGATIDLEFDLRQDG